MTAYQITTPWQWLRARVSAFLVRHSSPALDRANEALLLQERREMQPVRNACKRNGLSRKPAERVEQFYRDQRGVGVSHELAVYRAVRRANRLGGGV
jgi:hypothetical protein